MDNFGGYYFIVMGTTVLTLVLTVLQIVLVCYLLKLVPLVKGRLEEKEKAKEEKNK